MSAKPSLIAVERQDLRPTRIPVGGADIATQQAQWSLLKRREQEDTLDAHWFPAIRGLGGKFFIVDHHHWGLAPYCTGGARSLPGWTGVTDSTPAQDGAPQ